LLIFDKHVTCVCLSPCGHAITCKNVSHLCVFHHQSIDVTQSKGITTVCLLSKLRLYCCVPMTHLYLSSREVTSMWTAQFDLSCGHVYRSCDMVTVTRLTFKMCLSKSVPDKPVMETVWQMCICLIVQCTIIGACDRHQWHTQNFLGGGGVQQIQLRTERTGIWGQ
jgi:hypothetical protein